MQQEDVKEKIEEVVKEDIWGSIQEFFEWGFHFGEGDQKINITVGLLLFALVSFFIASYILKGMQLLYTRKMDVEDRLKFKSVFKFIKYVTYIVVIIFVLSVSGINITPLLAASAALLVGLGLALQELFKDILGGIFIILDKSMMVGDIIEVDGKVSCVVDIKLRTTLARTRDDKIVIIPNHKFIVETIFNYTQNHSRTREFVTVGVAYGSDTRKVEQLLIDSAMAQSEILKDPKPFALFEDFGDSALVFSVYFFIKNSFNDPAIKSDVRFKIDQKFRENDITIPFPQRDVHLFGSKESTSSTSD